MASDPPSSDTPTGPAVTVSRQPSGATYHDPPGNGLAAVSLTLGALASLNLIGNLLFGITNRGYGTIQSVACAILGLALAITAKNKFKAVGHPTSLPSASVIVNVVGLAFSIIVSLFHIM